MPFPTLPSALARALAAQGYAEPTPVQAAVLEQAGPEADLLVSAQTGSGKTVAFGLAMGETLLGDADALAYAATPLALIVAPTRELALQVARELEWLWKPAGAVVATCVGGMDPRKEQRALAAGAHIVVGTPGRLVDHLERGNLDPSSLRVVVLDEADEMLDLGFREDLELILDAAPAERRTLMFSATIARDIAALAKKFQRDAVRIDTVNRNEPHGDIEYRAIRVAPNEVERAVVNVLRAFEAPGALVFCSTREAVRHLYAALRERGFGVVQLSGELTQKERSDALQALRDGHARVCVATDVAARGLDLPDLGLVIHADLPVNKAALLHRSGRTGRAGKKGVSVVMVPLTRRRKAEQLLASAGIEAIWQAPPTAEDIRARDQARLIDDPTLVEAPAEEDLELARTLLESRSAEAVAAAYVRLWRSRLPEPEDVYAPAENEAAPRQERGGTALRERLKADEVEWFRATVGRANNADPKWIIPLICRLGHVTKAEIGSIRIFDRETKFEIAKTVAKKFAAAVEGQVQGDIRIEPSTPPGARPERGERPEREEKRPFHRERAERAPRAEFKPRAERPERGPRPEAAARPERKPRPSRPREAFDPFGREARPERAERPERPAKGAFKPGGEFRGKPEFKAKPKAEFAAKPDFAARPGPKKAYDPLTSEPTKVKKPKRKDNAGGKKQRAW